MKEKITNLQTNFEHWFSEILDADPAYMFNIVCNYYDACSECPFHSICKCGNSTELLTFLQSAYQEVIVCKPTQEQIDKIISEYPNGITGTVITTTTRDFYDKMTPLS